QAGLDEEVRLAGMTLAVAQTVVAEIGQELVELAGEGADAQIVGLHLEFDVQRRVAGRGEALDELYEPGLQADDLRDVAAAARELQDVLDDLVHAPAVLQDDVREAAVLAAQRGRFAEQLAG